MKTIKLGNGLNAPVIAVGCMRIKTMLNRELDSFISGCLDAGANFFDHADIYGGGNCESVFGSAVKRLKINREKLIIQSKCGIVVGKMFDFSYEHIIKSVNGSLKRLNTDYLDVLLLHRPDALMEPCEIARAFDKLHEAGKVRHFGVSNQHTGQIMFLKTAVRQPLVANQLQFSAAFTPMIDCGINVNMQTPAAVPHGLGVLEYMQMNDIAVQAWSPLQHGFFEGVFIDNTEKFPALNATLNTLAEKYKVTPSTIAYAFILRHPAKWQVVTGTTKFERIKEAISATTFTLTREEWYQIYRSAGNRLP